MERAAVVLTVGRGRWGFCWDRYASLERVSNWNLEFMGGSEQGIRFKALADQLDNAMEFMRACGIDEDHPIYKSTEFYTSHESLLLDYETALTRLDSTTNQWYGCSAHLLWIGERTRQVTQPPPSLSRRCAVGA